MARGKKKEAALPPAERLQAALVPDWEQPYKVPENWCWVYLQTLCEIPITDGTHKTPKYSDKENGIPFVSAKDVTKGFIDWSGIKYITQELHEELYQRLAPQIDDILLAKNGTTGVAALVTDSYVFDLYVTLAVLRPNKKLIIPRYLYYLVNSPLAKIQFDSHLTGIGVPNLHLRDIKITAIPFPPFIEQQRIVDRIESLFAKLDEAKQKAQDALDSFETRKASILHKAFTGELTAQWRKEHGVGVESWNHSLFEDCILKMQNGLAKRSGSSGKPVIVLRLANLSDTGFVTDDLREIILDEKEQNNYTLKKDDILMIRVNGSKDNVGKQFLFYGNQEWAFCDHIIRITYKKGIIPAYMVYFSKTNAYRRYIEDNMVSSAGQNTISRKGMASLLISLPLLNEQVEIVRILDDLLAKEQQAKETAEKVLEQIDLTKKAILARAFRGELGTNDPSEESGAVELIKQLIKE